MKVMAAMRFDPTRRNEIMANVAAEQARVAELRAQGALEAFYFAQTQDRVWLVLSVGNEDEAQRILESLPLHPYSMVDVAPLVPAPA
jgi:muconolactone delta-isomerase